MQKFLETIRFENGKYHLLELHQARIDRTFSVFYSGRSPIQLEKILPENHKSGKHKFRFEYDDTSHELESAPYQPKQISSIELIEADLDYGFKFANRMGLYSLLDASKADEIIIVKNGLISDSSYSNLAFYNGKDWLTPEQPLLAGIRRSQLLESRKIKTADISLVDLSEFKKVSLINAMLDLNELAMPMNQIIHS